jgi:hypothetical protein
MIRIALRSGADGRAVLEGAVNLALVRLSRRKVQIQILHDHFADPGREVGIGAHERRGGAVPFELADA